MKPRGARRPRRAGPPRPARPPPPPCGSAKFACRALQLNLRGGFARTDSPKVVELMKVLDDNACNIALLSEIWSTPSHLDGWQILARPRPQQRRGGGVAILARDDVELTSLDLKSPALRTRTLEFVAAKLRLPSFRTPVTVVSLYLPNGPTLEARKAVNELLRLATAQAQLLLVGGDFNCRHRQWDDQAPASGAEAEALLRMVESHDLTLLNNGCATHQADQAPYTTSAIDLSIADTTSAAEARWSVLDVVDTCDHFPLLCELWPTPAPHSHGPIISVWDVNSPDADWERWGALTQPWEEWSRTAASRKSADDVWNEWLCTFNREAALCVPKRLRPAGPRRQKAWWRPALKPLLQARYHARRRHREERSAESKAALAATHKAARDAIGEAKRNCLAELAEDLGSASPERFWKMYRAEFQPSQSGATPPLQLLDGTIAATPAEKAAALNKHFASVSRSRTVHALSCNVCSPPDDVNNDSAVDLTPPAPQTPPAQPSDDSAPLASAEAPPASEFTMEELTAALGRLRPKSAPGADGITPVLILRGSQAMRTALLVLINETWRRGHVPREWKRASVRPIPKRAPGQASAAATPASFRPISLLSVVGKIAERLVEHRLRCLVEERNLLPATQSGFRAHRSTLDCLTRVSLAAHRAFAKRQYLVIAMLDIDKAYDTVHRSGLLSMLRRRGITGELHKWLRSFLSDRWQTTTIEGATSTEELVEEGVPQGSVLSCILFNLFVSDLPDSSSAEGGDARFADDFAFWETADDVATACNTLQARLRAFDDWAARKMLHVSATKSTYTVLTRRKNAELGSLQLAGCPLRHEDRPKYLGMLVTPSLDWRPHLAAAATRAHRVAFCLRRLTRHLGDRGAPAKTLLQLFKLLVRPQWEYGAPVWSSAPPSALDDLSAVQHQALVAISGAWRATPREALNVDLDVLPVPLRVSELLLRWESRILRLPEAHPLRTEWLRDVTPFLRDPPASCLDSVKQRLGASMPQRLLITHRETKLAPEDPALAESLDLAPRRPAPTAVPKLVTCPDRKTAPAWVQQQLEAAGDVFALFTDGSVKGTTGAISFVLTRRGSTVAQGLNLGARADCSYGAELFAIMAALEIMVLSEFNHDPIHLFADCRSVLEVLAGLTQPTSHISLFNATCDNINRLHERGCPLVLYWIPGHAGIPLNERADEVAKAHLEAEPREAEPGAARLYGLYLQPLSSAHTRINCAVRLTWAERWTSLAGEPHIRAIKPTPVKWRHCWSAKRDRDRILCWLRHGTCLAAHLHKLHPRRPPLCDLCAVDEDVQHFLLQCRAHSGIRALMLREVDEILPNSAPNVLTLGLLLGTAAPAKARDSVADAVLRFVKRSERNLNTWAAPKVAALGAPASEPSSPASAPSDESGVGAASPMPAPPASPRADPSAVGSQSDGGIPSPERGSALKSQAATPLDDSGARSPSSGPPPSPQPPSAASPSDASARPAASPK